jgi:glutamate/aspartate transport system substrate-binding protein
MKNRTWPAILRHLAVFGAVAAFALPQGASAEDLSGTLQKIKETGSITVGYRDSSIPFSYYDANQQPIGFAMDICARVVDAVKQKLALPNLKVNYALVTSANRIPLMANGTIDLECGSTTNNADRKKQVDFANTYFLTASRYVTLKSSKIHAIADLKGKTVVSTAGTTNIVQLNNVNNEQKLGINVISAPGHAEAFLMVQTGRATAFVMDDVLLASLAASSKDPDSFELPPGAFSKPEPYGIMIRLDDPQFKAVVNDATAKLYTSPEMAKIYDKWFMSPIPPNNINLKLPMSDELKKAFAHPSDSPNPADY